MFKVFVFSSKTKEGIVNELINNNYTEVNFPETDTGEACVKRYLINMIDLDYSTIALKTLNKSEGLDPLISKEEE